MEIQTIIILVLSGIAVGFINTLAGGGTIISMTTFTAMGMPIIMAAGTNRIPVIMQNLIASIIFRKNKSYNLTEALRLSLPVMMGALISSQFTTMLTNIAFSILFSFGLIIFVILLFYKPNAWGRAKRIEGITVKPIHYIILLGIGLYSGSIYVGMGYMVLGILVVPLGFDLIQANAIKNLMALFVAPLSIIPFILTSNIDYRIGLIHGIGNIIGAYVASKYAIKLGVKFIKWLLIIMVLGSIVHTISRPEIIIWIKSMFH